MRRHHYRYSISTGFDSREPVRWVLRRDGGCASNAHAWTFRSAMRWAARFGPGASIQRWYPTRKGETGHRYREWIYEGPLAISRHVETSEQRQVRLDIADAALPQVDCQCGQVHQSEKRWGVVSMYTDLPGGRAFMSHRSPVEGLKRITAGLPSSGPYVCVEHQYIGNEQDASETIRG